MAEQKIQLISVLAKFTHKFSVNGLNVANCYSFWPIFGWTAGLTR